MIQLRKGHRFAAAGVTIEPVIRNHAGDILKILLPLLAVLMVTAGSGLTGPAALPDEQNPPQTIQHEVRVVNIEVPVRVFRGDTFVDSLSRDDFEVFENGVPQQIEAVYLVKKTTIERKEETKAFQPTTSRHFYLFFALYEYQPKVREAVDFFVRNIIQPGDELVVVTSKTTYRMKEETLTGYPPEKIVDRLTGMIKKDITAGDLAYRAVLNDLKRLVRSAPGASASTRDWDSVEGDIGEGTMQEFLMKYRNDLERLENLRTIDEKRLLEFADYLKDKKGQKFVYLFYQREFIPVLDNLTRQGYENDYIVKLMLLELQEFYKREKIQDPERLKRAFADSSIAIHFLYLTTRPNDILPSQTEEHSEDIYIPFSEMADATGGLASSSANIAYLMEKASGASENYYLLYYSPKDATPDGTFRRIEVRIKSGGYRVTNQAGYFAR